MSTRPRPRLAAQPPGSEVILQAIKTANKTATGYRCPRCKLAVDTEEAFEKHLEAHIQAWQQDLARVFQSGMDHT